MNIPLESILPIVGQLGIGAIFLWLFLEERKSNKLERKSNQEIIEEQQTKHREAIKQERDKSDKLTEKVISVVENNTKSMTAQTEVARTLTHSVYEALREMKGDKK